MIVLDGNLTTDDMAFAVTLILHGYEPEMDLDGRKVVWTIANESEDDLRELVSDWSRSRLRVEPRRFARELAATRKDVYKLLGISDKPKGEKVNRRGPSGNHA